MSEKTVFIHALTGIGSTGEKTASLTYLPRAAMEAAIDTDLKIPVIRTSTLMRALRHAKITINPENISYDPSLLLLPVRTPAGLFAWITCPAALGKMKLLGSNSNQTIQGFTFNPEVQAYVTRSCQILLDRELIIEEYFLRSKYSNELDVIALELAKNIFSDPGYEWWQKKLQMDLVVVSNQTFAAMLQTALEIRARVAGNSAQIARKTPYLYEELFPAEAVLITALAAENLPTETKLIELGNNLSTGRGLSRLIMRASSYDLGA
ncbi:hypothetical protein JNK13_05555 [bacterium]|nr:hypothetical protein [bacterium]